MFVSIGLLVFLNFQQPYVLEVMLGIPEQEHGRVIAKMGLVHEIVLISLVGPFGALSDRIGRRPVAGHGLSFYCGRLHGLSVRNFCPGAYGLSGDFCYRCCSHYLHLYDRAK